jgi:hypothetical protein
LKEGWRKREEGKKEKGQENTSRVKVSLSTPELEASLQSGF